MTVGQQLDSVLAKLDPADRKMYTDRVLHIVYAAQAVLPTYNRKLE